MSAGMYIGNRVSMIMAGSGLYAYISGVRHGLVVLKACNIAYLLRRALCYISVQGILSQEILFVYKSIFYKELFSWVGGVVKQPIIQSSDLVLLGLSRCGTTRWTSKLIPSSIFIMDVNTPVVLAANTLRLPCIGMVDTENRITRITYPVLSNNSSLRVVSLVLQLIVSALTIGRDSATLQQSRRLLK